jgi:hypothetical protein
MPWLPNLSLLAYGDDNKEVNYKDLTDDSEGMKEGYKKFGSIKNR